MVRFSSASAFKRVCLPFCWGRKPSKQNLSQGKPEFTKAGISALAQGKHSTAMPSRTAKNPGSEMPGVPASLTKATVAPVLSRLITFSNALCSLYT